MCFLFASFSSKNRKTVTGERKQETEKERGEQRMQSQVVSVLGSMEQDQQSAPSSPKTSPPPKSYILFMNIMSKRRTWVCLFVLVYAIILSCSYNFLKSILSWYKIQTQRSSSAPGWPALYASVLLGAVFGVLSMVAALAVAVPATLVIWITIVVLLAFFGKPKRTLVVEGRKITKEIIVFLFKILLREGNLVAAVCAVLGYFALVRRNSGEVSS